jgi:hypothetical protein
VCATRWDGSVGKGDDTEPPWRAWRADAAAVSGIPADVAMSRLANAAAGSVKSRRASPYEVLCGRLLIVGRMGAEYTRWLARRESLAPAAFAVRCSLDEERRLVMEKERLGRDASSDCSAEGRLRDCEGSLVANTVVKLSGVPGLKYTFSPSSLAESSTSSAPAATALASTSVGLCLSSGNILLKPPACADEPLLLTSVRSLVIRAVKNCAYSTSLSVLASWSSVEGFSAVISSSSLCCCSVALRW